MSVVQWCIAAMVVVLLSQPSAAFVGDVRRTMREMHQSLAASVERSREQRNLQEAVAAAQSPSAGSSSSASALEGGEAKTSQKVLMSTRYRARANAVRTVQSVHEYPPKGAGMRFSLRDDGRCFMVEMDRPGDHMLAVFRVWSNISEVFWRRNVTVEVFSPTWKYVAEYHFHPLHVCVQKGGPCLVRVTPKASESSADAHGVETGAYSICFRRNAAATPFAFLLNMIRKVSDVDVAEDILVELLDLSSTQSTSASVHSASEAKQSVASGRGETPVAVARLNSIANRIKLLDRTIADIERESLNSIERRASFDDLSNETFTRTWVLGLLTCITMCVVVAVEHAVLRSILRKKKLV